MFSPVRVHSSKNFLSTLLQIFTKPSQANPEVTLTLPTPFLFYLFVNFTQKVYTSVLR